MIVTKNIYRDNWIYKGQRIYSNTIKRKYIERLFDSTYCTQYSST